jgi:SRSO17 transposase
MTRSAAKIPEDVAFLTKPAMAREMIARALDVGVPCEWVLGDAVYGSDRRLRMMLEERGQPHLLGIRGNDTLWSELDGRVRAGGAGASPAASGVAAAEWGRRANGFLTGPGYG